MVSDALRVSFPRFEVAFGLTGASLVVAASAAGSKEDAPLLALAHGRCRMLLAKG